VQTDDDTQARIPKVLRMGMTLAAIANDGDCFARKRIEIASWS